MTANVAKLSAIETGVLGLLERRGRKIAAEDAQFLRGVIAANKAAAPSFAAAGVTTASGVGAAAATAQQQGSPAAAVLSHAIRGDVKGGGGQPAAPAIKSLF